jgi:penicillin-binding protein 2
MHDLLTDAARSSINRSQFQNSYVTVLNEATATTIRTELYSLLHEESQAQAGFRTEWQTVVFGPLIFDYTMTLLWVEDRWGIAWSPSLILPGLDSNLKLIRLDQIPTRGHIYDRNGLGLAGDGQRVTIGIVPNRIQDGEATIAQVSAITGIATDVISNKIVMAKPDWFVPIADVSPEVSIANNDLLSSMAGITRREHTVRAYQEGNLAAHLVGHLGAIPFDDLANWQLQGYRESEMIGRAGVEAWGESYLAGRRGARLVTVNRQNNDEVAQIAQIDSQPGSSIYLTIDKVLQAEAERILGQRPGAIVVLDSNTGFVLAMASYPRFDPNLLTMGMDQETWSTLNANPNRPFVNRGTLGAYPAGSVFKIVTIAAGMEKLDLTADTSFFCTGTWNRLGDQFIKTCWLETGHGRINLQEGLTQSCDSVFYDVGLALENADPQILPDMARAFGLGAATGITGVDEITGLVPDPVWKSAEKGEDWFPGDSVNLAIGQGYLLVTPLQIANMLAAMGNGGVLYRPQLIQRISNPNGSDQMSQPEVLASLPVTPENLAVIRTGLEGVVSGPRGTARKAFEGTSFTAAGKTGTAESGQEEPHAWFAGYAPANSPEIAVAVVVEHAGEGSKEAAPLFRQIVEAYLSSRSATR